MNGFLTGFNHATASGPLCEEPMQGACFIVQNVDLLEGDET
jgi:ribosome assembly protein 1